MQLGKRLAENAMLYSMGVAAILLLTAAGLISTLTPTGFIFGFSFIVLALMSVGLGPLAALWYMNR